MADVVSADGDYFAGHYGREQPDGGQGRGCAGEFVRLVGRSAYRLYAVTLYHAVRDRAIVFVARILCHSVIAPSVKMLWIYRLNVFAIV